MSMYVDRLAPARSLDGAAATFVDVRPRLFGIAYRMLGVAAEAEDIVQETWLRWRNTERSTVADPAAFLVLIATRLSLNAAQYARDRREAYVGPWLPEPVDTGADPALGAERCEALDMGVLLLLEKLSPEQRAAYILREAFDCPYEQIAEILRLSPVDVRRLVGRSHERLDTAERESVDEAEHRRLMATFLEAAREGDVAALEGLFAAEVVSVSDGNGIPGAARFPLAGANRVARFVAALARNIWSADGIRWVQINGRAGLLIPRGPGGSVLLAVDAAPEGIRRLMWVLSPDKLGGFARPVGGA